MRLQQPIQEIGIHSRYLGDAEFHEKYDDKIDFGVRALARAAHAKPHIAVKTQKSSNFGLGGRIFYRRARGSARAPKSFPDSKSL